MMSLFFRRMLAVFFIPFIACGFIGRMWKESVEIGSELGEEFLDWLTADDE